MDSAVHLDETDDAVPAEQGNSSPRAPWALVTLITFPGMVVLGLGVNLVTPMNGVDEFIYVGVVERIRDYLLRWPDTYYAVRFGYILPEWSFERAFGERFGYLVLRLSILGLIAVGCRANRRLGIGPALLGASVVVASPIVLVALFNNYVMALALAFLLLGASLLSNCWAGFRLSRWIAFCAGIVLTMSWNSHLVALPICLVVAGVFAIDGMIEYRGSDLINHLVLVTCVAVGTAGTVAAGMFIYRWQFNVTDLYGPTLHQARQDTNEIFIDKISTWITWRHYLLVGPLGVCAGFAAWWVTTDDGVRRSIRRLTAMTVLAFVMFAWFEWVRRVPLLSNFIYSCMPLGLALLTLGRSLASLANDLLPSHRRLIVIAALLSVAVVGSLDNIKPGFAVVVILSLLSIGLLAYFRRSPRERFFAACGVLLVASFATVSSPHDFPAASAQYRVDPNYDHSLFTYDWSGLNQVDVADQFARSLPSLPASRGEIRIWFDSSGEMNEVISTLVWYRSALQMLGDPSMPEVSDTVRQRVVDERPRWVVVLDDNSGDVDAGIVKIEALGPYRLEWKKTMRSGSDIAVVALLQATGGNWADFPCYNVNHQGILC